MFRRHEHDGLSPGGEIFGVIYRHEIRTVYEPIDLTEHALNTEMGIPGSLTQCDVECWINDVENVFA